MSFVLDRTSLRVLAGLICVALLTLTLAQGFHPLWLDELSVLVTFSDPRQPFTELMILDISRDSQPPFHYLLVWQLFRWFGVDDVIARLPSLFSALLFVLLPFLWRSSPLTDSERWLWSALMAVSYVVLSYGSEARGYMLCAALCSVLMVIALETATRHWRGAAVPSSLLLAFVGIGILAGHTHYFGLLWAGALTASLMLVCLVERNWQRMVLYATAGCGIVVGMLPWLILREMHHTTEIAWIGTGFGYYMVEGYRFLRLFSGNFVGVVLVLGLLALGLPALLRPLLDRPSAVDEHVLVRARMAAFLLAAMTIMAVLAIGISETVQPIITFRNPIVVMPALFLLLALIITNEAMLPRWLRAHQRVLVLALPLVLFVASVADYFATPKQNWRGSAEDINAMESCRDAKIVIYGYGWTPAYQYYLDPAMDIELIEAGLDHPPEHTRAALTLAGDDDCPVRVWMNHVFAHEVAGFLDDLGVPEDERFIEYYPAGAFLLRHPPDDQKAD